MYHVMKETNQKPDIDAKMNVTSMVQFIKFYKIIFSKRFLGLKINGDRSILKRHHFDIII